MASSSSQQEPYRSSFTVLGILWWELTSQPQYRMLLQEGQEEENKMVAKIYMVGMQVPHALAGSSEGTGPPYDRLRPLP